MPQKGPQPEFLPVKDRRIFAAGRMYDQVDWNDWEDVIDAFRDQMEGWYLKPICELRRQAEGHYAFAVMSLCCTLVDALSQYYYGKPASNRKDFIAFLNQHFPAFSDSLSTPISKGIRTFSEAMYHGFRCGVLHAAHPALYTVIFGTGHLVMAVNGNTLHSDGSSCPTVVIDPALFHDRLVQIFEEYLSELRVSTTLQENFAVKFLESYGIDIGHER